MYVRDIGQMTGMAISALLFLYRQVLRVERERARPEEQVGERAFIDERRDLALADDELGAVLDLVLVTRKAPHHRVRRVVDPLDDVDQLAAKLVPDAHGHDLRQNAIQYQITSFVRRDNCVTKAEIVLTR